MLLCHALLHRLLRNIIPPQIVTPSFLPPSGEVLSLLLPPFHRPPINQSSKIAGFLPNTVPCPLPITLCPILIHDIMVMLGSNPIGMTTLIYVPFCSLLQSKFQSFPKSNGMMRSNVARLAAHNLGRSWARPQRAACEASLSTAGIIE